MFSLLEAEAGRSVGFQPIASVAENKSEAAKSPLIRIAAPDDAGAIASLIKRTYQACSHPCAHEDKVAELLQSGRMRILIAIERGEVIGCVAGKALRVSGVVELGCLVVHSDKAPYRLAHMLHDRIVRHVIASDQCDLVVAFSRTPSVVRLGYRHALVPLEPCGHDGAMHVSNGIREHHIACLATNPNRIVRRAKPARFHAGLEKAIARKRNIISESQPAIQAWSVATLWQNPTDDRPSSIELPAAPLGESAAEAIDFVRDASREKRHVPHQYLFALADKPDFIEGLHGLGFDATAYLPAWHRVGDVRHDCIMMVLRDAREITSMNGADRCIRAWDRRLNRTHGWQRQSAQSYVLA